jgi:hypothetical protein
VDFLIAIGATVLLFAFYGLARVLYAVAPVIGALYLLAFVYGILATIYGRVCKWPEVAVPVLFFAVLYFRRKPALPLPKADMPVNSRASTSSADQRSSSGRGYQRHAATAVSSRLFGEDHPLRSGQQEGGRSRYDLCPT